MKSHRIFAKPWFRVMGLCLFLGAVLLVAAIFNLPALAEPPTPLGHKEPSLLTPNEGLKSDLSNRDDSEQKLQVTPKPEVGQSSGPERSGEQRPSEATFAQQGIYGQVTHNGAPASGVGLNLRFYNGSTWSTAATTTTGGDGRYDFVGAPSLGSGQTYYVRYDNSGMGDSYLWYWLGPDITTYAAGSVVHGGDFDIANVSLLDPPNDVTRNLPVTFRWARRELPGDTYRLYIYDPDTGFEWTSSDLGDTDSYTLESLVSGMEYGHPYRWTVWVYNGSDSLGLAYYYSSITFATGTPTPTTTPPAGAEGIHGQVTHNGAPASGVGLNLRFYNGSTWSTAATTTTGGDGRYDFVGAPSLGSGQTYYVRYDNSGMGDSYLWYWLGPDITTYAAGSVVHGGDFDIANVSLLDPPNDVTRNLPVTFRWARRELPGDTYRLYIYDPDTGFEWTSSDLGDTDSYTLESLVSGMEYGHPYRWTVWVYNGSDSLGLAYYYSLLTFAAGAPTPTPTTTPTMPYKVFLPLILKNHS